MAVSLVCMNTLPSAGFVCFVCVYVCLSVIKTLARQADVTLTRGVSCTVNRHLRDSRTWGIFPENNIMKPAV